MTQTLPQPCLPTALPKTTRIAVGMSGGVDSSVTALLLKKAGFDVIGIFMKNWEGDDTDEYCSASEDIAYALSVCDQLNVPFEKVNFAQNYWDHVFQYFLEEYKAGRTPNPDILCNKEIKFKAFLDYSKSFGADYIATGHYANIKYLNGNVLLCRAADANKDQTYFLHALSQSQLRKALFPIGHLTKPQVRDLAKAANLPNYSRKDSTGICFIGERKFKTFLETYLPAQPGKIVDDSGKILGEHQGLMYYTLGQRKGIGIGGRHEASDDPWYVALKNLSDNTLVVVQGHDHPLLHKSELTASQLNWISGEAPASHFHCTAKTRYRQQDQACEVLLTGNGQATIRFEQPQRAITPGQSVVLYQESVCLGGGVIVD